jgi:peptidoglycan/xylan/chitin deacetylase (PgdA/CDA1 family)
MYHRVNGGNGVDGLNVDVFREQLRMIKKDFHPMALDDLVKAGERGTLPDNAVALTFDDGYRDFYEHAFPLLEEMGLPATLFVTTGFVSGELWLWPDQLKYVLENTNQKYLNLSELEASLETAAQRHVAWNLVSSNKCSTARF